MTISPPTTFVTSTPDPQVVTLVAALLRHLLTISAGLGFAVGTYSDSTIAMLASAIVGAATIGWSLWQKFRAARSDHAGSVQSAAAGTPLKPA